MKILGVFEPVRVVVIIALAIGMGIAVHEVFFLAALVLTAVAAGRAIEQHIHRMKPVHRHL